MINNKRFGGVHPTIQRKEDRHFNLFSVQTSKERRSEV